MSGLEILGAVASSIALAQAVKGTIKAVNLLREIRQIRQQCDDLKNEIVTIDGFILEAVRLAGPPSCPQPPPGTTQEHPMVSRTVRELQGILEALNQIVSKYSHDRKWHERIARKMQWLSEGKKIEELARKAQNTKLNLHLAIALRISSSVDRIGTQQEVILHSIRQRTVYCLEGSQHSQTGLLSGPLPGPIRTPALGPVERQVEETELEDDSCSETSETSTQSTTESLQLKELQNLSSADESDSCAIFVQEESYMGLTTIQPLGTRRCGQDCQCRCHRNLEEHNSYSWMSAVLGTWCVRNQAVDRTCELQCGPSTGPEFEYRFPRWLWPGVIPFGGYQRGRQGLTVSLRAPRTIGWKEEFWRWIKDPSLLQQRIKEGWVYFPDDSNEFGQVLIEVAIIAEAYESIMILLELWKNLLPQQGLPRRVGCLVNYAFVHYPSMVSNGKVRHVLEKALSFARAGRSLRKIHMVAMQGHTVEMRQVLREQPETINEIDACGLSPIHYAVMYSNTDILEQLILAGAQTCSRDLDGDTPLMIAAKYGYEEAVRALLQNQHCRRGVGLKNNRGETALHHAVEAVSPKCVRILLEAGASTEKRGFVHRSPLHLLARSEAGQQKAHQIICLFKERHALLDTRNSYGETPLMKAVQENNVPVLHALVVAGASLNTMAAFSQNILHLIASYAHLETMSYLAEQNLTLVDPRLRSVDRRTPLSTLCWCLKAEDWQLVTRRRPSPIEQQVFISLYFDLLSRCLLRQMSTLKQLLRAARRRDASAASKHINTLVEESEARNEGDLVSWYRGIMGYIKDENWHVVVEIVREEMRETRGELGLAAIARDAPPWDPVVREFFW